LCVTTRVNFNHFNALVKSNRSFIATTIITNESQTKNGSMSSTKKKNQTKPKPTRSKSKNAFNYDLDFISTDFRKHPELYRIGVGEQGVLLVQPYKSEILPFWKFKTEDAAKSSAKKIYEMFEEYLDLKDFVGADMARKFLQMGFTRARRYANHKSGRKYQVGDTDQTEGLPYPYSSGSKNKGNDVLEQEEDALTNEKAKAAQVFKTFWFKAKDHPEYLSQKQDFRERYYE